MALALSLGVALPARAEVPPETGAAPPSVAASVPASPPAPWGTPQRYWFRGYLGAAYAAPLALILTAARVSPSDRGAGETLGYVALASLALAPVVRIAEGASADIPAALMGTVGLAAGGAVAGLGVGAVLCDKAIDSDCIARPIEGAVVGLFVGYITWAVIDSVFLAYREVPASGAALGARPGLALAPFVLPLLREPTLAAPSRLDGCALGIAARF